MLEELAREIRAGGTFETHELAARLGTTPQLIEAMLEHLRRMNVIQAYVGCNDGCLGCSLQDNCRKPGENSMRLWQSKSEY